MTHLISYNDKAP